MKREYLGNLIGKDCVYEEEPDIHDEPVMIITATGRPKLRSIKQFLALPFFSLKKKDMDKFHYKSNDGSEEIKIIPSGLGRPTVYDKDFIIYIISYIQELLDKGEITTSTPNAVYKFDVNQLMEHIGRKPARNVYKNGKLFLELIDTGVRLSSQIVTTIRFGNKEVAAGRSFISEWTLENDKETNKLVMFIKLADWIYAAIMKDNKPSEILTLDKNYYQIPIGLERRIYEILRQKMGIFYTNGNKPLAYYQIKMSDLKMLCGSTSEDKEFTRNIKKIITDRKNVLLHWHISIKNGIFYARNLNRIKNAKSLKEQGEMIRHAQSVK